jgi:ferritin
MRYFSARVFNPALEIKKRPFKQEERTMMKKKMQEALNNQINEELYSSYIYEAMVAYFEEENLPGCAQWMRLQADEEIAHARKIRDYLFERGARVKLQAIKEPPLKWASALDAFEAAYKHECHISECIDKLASLAQKEEDHATRNFLEWFIAEQVEEEANADNMVQQLKRAKDAPGALFMIDREAGQRQAGGGEEEA